MNAMLLAPEILLALVTGLALWSSWRDPAVGRKAPLSLGALAAAAATLAAWPLRGQEVLPGYTVDGLSLVVKAVLAVCLAVVLHLHRESDQHPGEKRLDARFLVCLASLGLAMTASARELGTAFLALELSSFSLYVLPPMYAGSRAAAEAGARYALFGALSGALSLFGLSFLLFAHGSLDVSALAAPSSAPLAHTLGAGLFFAALAFKLTLVPMQAWAARTYESTQIANAAILATLPKIGALALIVRFAQVAVPAMDGGTSLWVLGVASMFFGNLAALHTRNLKKIMAYSGVAQAGYLTIGLAAASPDGLAAAVFYGLQYVLTTAALFVVIFAVAGEPDCELDDLRGLSRRSLPLTFILVGSVAGLIGLPPFTGFISKLFLLQSAVKAGFVAAAVLTGVNTAISLAYYVRLARLAFAEPREALAPKPAISQAALGAGLALTAALAVLGIFPSMVYRLIASAISGLGGL